MGMLYPENRMAAPRNRWTILFCKILLFLNLAKHTLIFFNSKESESAFIFSLASVVVELLALF